MPQGQAAQSVVHAPRGAASSSKESPRGRKEDLVRRFTNIRLNFSDGGSRRPPARIVNLKDGEVFDLDTLESGKPITKKGYDYAAHLRADSDELIYPPEVLIMEGIHMFYDHRLLDRMVLKVYMHVDTDICLLRRIKRDIKSRGRTIDNIAEQYVETVKPMYEKYIVNYITDADFAIMRGGKNKMAIDCISAYLTTKVLAERFEKESGKPKPAAEESERED